VVHSRRSWDAPDYHRRVDLSDKGLLLRAKGTPTVPGRQVMIHNGAMDYS